MEGVVSVAQNQRGEVVLAARTQALSTGGGKPGQGYPCVAFPAYFNSPVARRLDEEAAREESEVIAFHHTQDPISGRVTPALSAHTDGMGVAHAVDFRHATLTGDVAQTLQAKNQGGYSLNYMPGALVPPMRVRRLTPRECERLQGFPDDYTLVPYRRGVSADGPRYKALGNSMAVPVMRWIGERIAFVDSLDVHDSLDVKELANV